MVGERRAGPHELGARIEQRPQGIDLAPFDRVARGLEAGVEQVVGVCLGRRPVRVAVVARDRVPRHLERQRGREQFVRRRLPVNRRMHHLGGEAVALIMRLQQQLDLTIQVLAHRHRPTVEVGHERSRGHGCEHNPRRVC